jgi:hypothetical protein
MTAKKPAAVAEELTADKILWYCRRLCDPEIEYIGKYNRIGMGPLKTDHRWLHEVAAVLETLMGEVPCPNCKGTGRHPIGFFYAGIGAKPEVIQRVACPHCGGTGLKYGQKA